LFPHFARYAAETRCPLSGDLVELTWCWLSRTSHGGAGYVAGEGHNAIAVDVAGGAMGQHSRRSHPEPHYRDRIRDPRGSRWDAFASDVTSARGGSACFQIVSLFAFLLVSRTSDFVVANIRSSECMIRYAVQGRKTFQERCNLLEGWDSVLWRCLKPWAMKSEFRSRTRR